MSTPSSKPPSKQPTTQPAQPPAQPRASNRRALPQPTPETQHFWDGTRAGELRLQRCDACAKVYFPPRPFCPACASRAVSVFAASGQAKLYSYVINHRAAPGSGFEAPYAIAVVELAEGPRMMTNIANTEQTPEALVLDMPLEVVFEQASEDIALPLFQPLQHTQRQSERQSTQQAQGESA